MPNDDDVISEQPHTWVLKTEEWRIWTMGDEGRENTGWFVLIFFCLMFIELFFAGGGGSYWSYQFFGGSSPI